MYMTGRLTESQKRDFSIVIAYLLLAQSFLNVRHGGVLRNSPRLFAAPIEQVDYLPVDISQSSDAVSGNIACPESVSQQSECDLDEDRHAAAFAVMRMLTSPVHLLPLSGNQYIVNYFMEGKSSANNLRGADESDNQQTISYTAMEKLELALRGIETTQSLAEQPKAELSHINLGSQSGTELLGTSSIYDELFGLSNSTECRKTTTIGSNGMVQMFEPVSITVRPLWLEQGAAASNYASTSTINKMETHASTSTYAANYGANPYPFKVEDNKGWLLEQDVSHLLEDYGLPNESEDYDIKPFGNFSDTNANELPAALGHHVSPCLDAALMPAFGENADNLLEESFNVSGLQIDGVWQSGAAAGPSRQKDGVRRYEGAAANWRAPSNSVETDYVAENEVDESNGVAGNNDLMNILTDIQQSVDELNDFDANADQRFESEAYTYARVSHRRASDDESGVRSLSHTDEAQLEIEYDPDLNAYGGYIDPSPHPEYAEVASRPSNNNYIQHASNTHTSARFAPRFGQPIRSTDSNTLLEEDEEFEDIECEMEDESDIIITDDASSYTIPKARADSNSRKRAGQRNRNHLSSEAEATESVSSWNDIDPSEDSYAQSDTRSRSHALSNANLPYGDDEIVHSSFARFEAMLTDSRLSEDDLQLMKDIRRRGKNKIAAMNCRRRKQQRVDTLADEQTELKRQNKALETKLAGLREQARAYDARLARALRQREPAAKNGRPVVVRA